MANMIPVLRKYLREPHQFTQGAYGQIYKGQTKIKKDPVIFKQCANHHDNAMREIKILNNIGKHPNIVSLLDYGHENGCIWLILEYCNGGELFDHCKKNKPTLEFTIDVVRQSAEALHHLHTLSTPIIHRDVQPRNILLHNEGYNLIVKLCDFGLSKLGDDEIPVNTWMVSSEVGTEFFKAPEMFDMSLYTATLDTFSLGLVLESMFHYGEGQSAEFLPAIAYPPRDDRPQPYGKFLSRTQKSYSIVKHHPRDSESHRHVKTLIDEMTQYDFTDRPQIAEVIDKLNQLGEGTRKTHKHHGPLQNVTRMDTNDEMATASRGAEGASNMDSGVSSLKDGIETLALTGCNTVPRIPVIKHGAQLLQAHNLPRKYSRIWNTADTDIMALGGAYKCIITLIRRNGTILKDNTLDVPNADMIRSGLHLYGTTHAVITWKRAATSQKCLIIDIDSSYFTVTENTNSDIRQPVTLFDINEAQFGMLSWQQKMICINVLSKYNQNIVSKTDVVYKNRNIADSAAALPHGGYVILSFKDSKIYMFSECGSLIEKAGTRADFNMMNIPGQFYNRRNITVDKEGGVLVIGSHGEVHRYYKKTWEIVANLNHSVWGMCVSGSELYTVFSTLNVYRI